MLEATRDARYRRERTRIAHQPYPIAAIPTGTPMTTQATAGTKSSRECQCIARSTPKKPPKAEQAATSASRKALEEWPIAVFGFEAMGMRLLTLELSGAGGIRLERIVRARLLSIGSFAQMRYRRGPCPEANRNPAQT